MRNLKKILAVICVVAMLASMLMVPALAATTFANEDEAITLNTLTVMNGMNLGNSVTRIEGLTFAIKAAGKDAAAQALTDAEVVAALANVVDADKIPAWGLKYAAYAVLNAMTTGTDASIAPKIKFDPLVGISGDSFLVWLLRSMGYTTVGTVNAWEVAVTEAKVLTLSQGYAIHGAAALIRDDVAGILFGALDNGVCKDGKAFVDTLIAAGMFTQQQAADAGLTTPPAAAAFGVDSVKALNLKQFEVKFAKAVDSDSAKDLANYEVKTDGNVDITGANVEVESDGMTVLFTLLDLEKANQQEKIDLVVEGVKEKGAESGLAKKTIEDIEFIDTTLPSAVSAEVVGNDTIKVKFSEPLLASTATKSAFSVNEGKLYVKSVAVMSNNTEVNVTLYSKLTAGTVKIEAKNSLTDAAGFSILSKTFDVAVVVDTTAPSVVGYKDAKLGEVTLIFDGDIKQLDATATKYYHTNTNNEVNTAVVQNGKELKLTFTENPLPEGTAYVYIEKEVLSDLWDNKNPKIQTQIQVTVDETPPVLSKLEVKSETQIKLTFDENVTDVGKSDFTVLDKDGKEVSIKRVSISGKEVTIDFYDKLSGDYTIVIEGIDDEADNTISKTTKTFKVDDLTAPVFTGFTATIYNASAEDQMIKVNFKEAMAIDGKYSVLDLEKYTVGSYDLADLDCDVTIVAVNGGKSIEITIPSVADDADDGVNLDAGDNILMARVADAAGNYTAALSGSIDVLGAGVVDIKSVEATGLKTIKVTFKDELAAFDVDDLIVYEDKNNDDTYDALEELALASASSLTTNSDGESVATITLANEIDANVTSNGHAVRLVTDIAANIDSKNAYGEKLAASDENAVADKIVPAVDQDSDDNDLAFTYDTNGNGKVDTIVVQYNEKVQSDYMTKHTFSAGNVSVTSVMVSDAANAAAASTDATSGDGLFVVIKLDETDSDLKVDAAFTPDVTQELPVYDAQDNKLDGGTAYNTIDKASPAINAADLTDVTGVATSWDGIGDELVLTFSEDVTLTVADTAAPITLTAAEVQAITGVAVAYDTTSTVTATVSNDTITLKISGAALTTGIIGGGNVNGTANALVKDKAGTPNSMIVGAATL